MRNTRRTIFNLILPVVPQNHQNSEYVTFCFHILDIPVFGGFIPLLEDKQRFPDSSFSTSASSEGHSASDARASSGSSWCAPVSNDKHYLQVDLGRLYYLDYLVTYGDSTSPKWVATYYLNYTVDLVNWTTVTRVIKNDKTNNNIIVFTYYCETSLFPNHLLLLFLFLDTSRKQKCLRCSNFCVLYI